MNTSQQLAGKCGDGVGNIANLQNAAPGGVERLSGERINQAAFSLVPFDTVLETQLDEFLRKAGRMAGGVAQQGQPQGAIGIEHGNAESSSGEGIVGVLRYKGEYFVFSGGGCCCFNDLVAHGFDTEKEADQYREKVLAYVAKYVLKGV